MKKSTLTLFLVWGFVFAFFCESAFSQTNQIANGGFENVSFPLNIEPNLWCEYITQDKVPGWKLYKGSPHIVNSPTSAHSGNNFLAMWNKKNTTTEFTEGTYTNLNINKGQNVLVKCWIKTNSGPANTLNVYATNGLTIPSSVSCGDPTSSVGGQVIGQTLLDFNNYSQWKQVSFRICGVNANYTQLYFYCSGAGTTEKWVYIDDIEVYVTNGLNVTPSITSCPNVPFTLSATGVGPFQWKNAYGTVIGSNASISFPNGISSTATYSVTDASLTPDGCPTTKSVTVTITPLPSTPTISQIYNPYTACRSNADIDWRFTASSIGATSYSWVVRGSSGNMEPGIGLYGTEYNVGRLGNVNFYPRACVTAKNACGSSAQTCVDGYLNYSCREGIFGEEPELIPQNLYDQNTGFLNIPNSAKDQLNINLVSLGGQMLKSFSSDQETVLFDVNDLEQGIYIINISGEKELKKYKVFISK